MKKLNFVFLIVFFSSLSLAQDYPYGDDPNTERTPISDGTALPKEGPSDNQSASQKKSNARSLLRLGIRGGFNYGAYQVPTEVSHTTIKGMGIEGIVGLGWDARYYPIFFEVESGYRRLFLGETEPFHVVPLGLGFYFRERIGPRSLFKWGFRSGIDFRYSSFVTTSGDSKFSWGLIPYWGVGAQIELNSFLIEPFFYLGRIQTDANFFSTGLRVGLRF